MRQLPLLFPDDEDRRGQNDTFGPTLNPDVARVLAEVAMEEELARLSPEERQKHWARRAALARLAAVESRRR